MDDVDWNANPTMKFPQKDGNEIRYLDYYLQAYDIRIQDSDQPLLLSRPRKQDLARGMGKDIFLIPELCFLTGTGDMQNDFNVKREMHKHTRLPPDKRVAEIMKYMDKIQS